MKFESNEDTDRGAREWLKGDGSATSRLRSAYDLAVETKPFHAYLDTHYGYSPIEHSLRGRPPICINDANDFPNIVEAIYQVRCNLFHGRKRANAIRDIQLVTISGRILQKWVANLLAS